ncbi:MAG: TrkA family potassium uptake protein [Candidatus Marinimicrobia bacterium]|nr:TrkA family potassium uptake protein [Candidatus Neomarinimicrobiota bacterium]
MKKQSFYILIIGCSRLGVYIANNLSKLGHSVVIIDEDESSFILLDVNFSGFKIEGNPAELETLRQAKIAKADIVIVTTRDDNINIMVAQIAKEIFKVPRVMARIFDPVHEGSYLLKNIDTICPTSLAGDILLKAVTDRDEGK